MMTPSAPVGAALLLVVCTQLLHVSEARRQLPQSLLDRDVLCETCYAVTTEMYLIIKRTGEGSLEERIDGALQQVCSPKLLGRFAFPADVLVNSCRDLIVRFENELGLGLMATFQPGRKPSAAATVKDICVARMKACKKTSAIPSLQKSKETASSNSSLPHRTGPAEQDPTGPQAGAATAPTPDRDVTGDRSADRVSPPAVSVARKDEL